MCVCVWGGDGVSFLKTLLRFFPSFLKSSELCQSLLFSNSFLLQQRNWHSLRFLEGGQVCGVASANISFFFTVHNQHYIGGVILQQQQQNERECRERIKRRARVCQPFDLFSNVLDNNMMCASDECVWWECTTEKSTMRACLVRLRRVVFSSY